jgi:hypothetical protein
MPGTARHPPYEPGQHSPKIIDSGGPYRAYDQAALKAPIISAVAAIQRLKGQGLGLRRSGLDAESGLGEESVDEGGPVLPA